MQHLWRWVKRIDGLFPCLILIGAAALVTLIVCVYCVVADGRFRDFAQDPAAHHYYPAFDGLLSHMAVLFWGASAFISFFGALMLRRAGASRHIQGCFFVGGLLGLLLWADDLLLLHERVFPGTFGVPEKVVFGIYSLLGLAWLVWYRRVLLAHGRALLGGAGALFAACILLDLFWPFGTLQFLLEDSAKLFGTAVWVSYFMAAVSGHLFAELGAASHRADGVADRAAAPTREQHEPQLA